MAGDSRVGMMEDAGGAPAPRRGSAKSGDGGAGQHSVSNPFDLEQLARCFDILEGLLANVRHLVGAFNREIYVHRWMVILFIRLPAYMLPQNRRLHNCRSG
jgi:hypothetical protein